MHISRMLVVKASDLNSESLNVFAPVYALDSFLWVDRDANDILSTYSSAQLYGICQMSMILKGKRGEIINSWYVV